MIYSIDSLKHSAKIVLDKYGVKKAGLFGSYARGDYTSSSDLDIVVELPSNASLLDLSGLKIELEDVFGKRVDIVTYRSLHKKIKPHILKEEKKLL